MHFRLSAAVMAVCRVSLPNVSLLPAKLSLKVSRVSMLVLLTDFFGLHKSVWQIRLTFPSAVAGRPDPFALHRQPPYLNFFF